MRKILVPVIFVLLVTLAAVVPVAANTADEAPVHSGQNCSSI